MFLPNQSALLLVDIQNDFCQGGSLAVPNGDEVVSVANVLMPKFKQVIATQDWHPRDHISFQDSPFQSAEIAKWPSHCVQYSSGAELHPQLQTHLIDLRVKKDDLHSMKISVDFSHDPAQISCDLEQHLKQQHITELYVMGLATDFCVMQTVLDALKLGFQVTVIEDGVRGIGNPEQLQTVKEHMQNHGANFIHSSHLTNC